MAYTARDFHKDLAVYSAGGIIGVRRTRKMLTYAARRGIQLAAFGARAGVGAARVAAPAAATVARRHPYGTAAALGYGAYRAGAFDPVVSRAEEEAEMIRQRAMDSDLQRSYEMAGRPDMVDAFKTTVKRKASKYNRAVKAGMAAVKQSKFMGKKGKISNAKAAFKTVNIVASAVNKGKKTAKSGVRGVISRAVRRIL